MSMSKESPDSDVIASQDDLQKAKAEEVPQLSDVAKTESSTTPPTSPPALQNVMASQSQEMPPPAVPASKIRKRSRGESADITINVPDSSASAADDTDSLAFQERGQDASIDPAATIMQNQRLARSSQPVPTSAQSAEASNRQHTTARPGKTPKTAPAPKQAARESCSDESEPNSDMTTAPNDPSLPEDQIDYFDWSELEYRYHIKCAEQQNRELAIFQDLSQLISFFEVWADVGGRKESDRGFKRLKTQMAYVQHEEAELETKRLHYIRVVDAFKTVGIMMNEPNWAQSFVPDHQSLSKVRRSISRDIRLSDANHSRPEKRKRDSRVTPLIKAEEWAVRVVGDVDMERFSCRDPHVARCVIL